MPAPSNAGPNATQPRQRTLRPLLLASEYFTRQTADPASVADTLIVRAAPAQIKVLDESKRTLRIRITDATEDRYRDVVDPKGGDFKNFKANAVVPWCHDYWQPPVARDTGLEITPDAVYGNPQFATAEEYAFADTVYRLCVAGYVNAASIGFMPTKWAYDEKRGGYDILEWELWEYSIVPIPANPSCLIEARDVGGIHIAPIAKWAEELLGSVNGAGAWVSKEDAEAAYFIAAGQKKLFIPRGALKGIEAADVQSVLAGDVQLLAADGTVLRTLVTRDGEGAAAGTEGAAAGADAGAGDGAAAGTTGGDAAAGDAGAEGGGAAGDGAGAAQAGADGAADGTADAGTKALELPTGKALADAVIADPEALAGLKAALGLRDAPPAATPPADATFGLDEAVLRQAASEVLNETFAPLQAALTSVTGHLG